MFFETLSVTRMAPAMLNFFLIDPQPTVFSEAMTSLLEFSTSKSYLNPVGVRRLFVA